MKFGEVWRKLSRELKKWSPWRKSGREVDVLLLHVSDTHLGSSKPLQASRTREMDFYEVFDEVVDIAKNERVDAVIHCGDFFDNPDPHPRAYYHAVRSLKKLASADIQFYVIAGQHDKPKRADIPPLKVLEEVGVARVLAIARPAAHVLKLRSGELGVTAVPHEKPEEIQKWVRELKKPEANKSILMAHLLVKELGFPWSHISLSELDVSDYVYVALGDLHRRYSDIYRGIPVVYPGSPEALKIDERSDERFVAIVDLSSRETVVNWVKLSRFRKMTLLENVRNFDDFTRALTALNLGGSGKPPILYVELGKLRDTYSIDERRIKARLAELVRQKLILEYRVVPPEIAEVGRVDVDVEVDDRPLTLDRVVREVLKDSEVAEFLLKILESSEEVDAVKNLIHKATGDEKLLSKLEKLVVRK
ncbi:MAG: DNA repair exonuclease [Sulfolobales archaeon]|nr:DNA repair exonuclease [Sulfolobales archaeon]